MTDRTKGLVTLAGFAAIVWAIFAAFRSLAGGQLSVVAVVILIVSAILLGAMSGERKFREEMEDD